MIEYTVYAYDDGDVMWCLNGKLHREDGPAIEYPDGRKFWYLNGKKLTEEEHAEKIITSKGETMIKYTVHVYDNDNKFWYLNGELHREDGPAVEFADGTKEWYLHGKLHRENGPACEYCDGTKSWYLHGEKLTESEHAEKTAPAIEMTVAEICEALGKRIKVVE